MLDVLVAGGGPVGLGAAIMAARSGLRVGVVEPRDPPIDKACGEGLMPGAVTTLRGLGVDPPGRPFVGIRYLDGRRVAAARFHGGPGLGVRRTALHGALQEVARDRGVEILRDRVTDVRQGPGAVEALMSHGCPVTARYLIAADGLHSPLRRSLGLSLPSGGRRRYGLRRHFAVEPWSDHVDVHWARGAEAYVTPVADDLVGVALLFSGRGAYADWLARFPALAERLAGVAAASPVRGAGPLRQRARTRVYGRVLLVGDAAGYVDALTGEGIRLGLAAGAKLIHCLRADRPGDYEREWLRTSRSYRFLTAGLVGAGRNPWLRPAIVPAAAALPGVFTRTVNELAGSGV